LQSANGCDSVVTLNLTIKPTATGTDVQTACGSYKWIDGNEYTSSNNTATFTLQSANGCDSVVTLNLTIKPTATGTDVQTACGSYKWIDGKEYTSSNNTATFTLQSANGCDSVVTLNLTIKPTATGTDVQTACGSYKWIDGNEYTSSNSTETFTLQSANGCDSVVTLNLTIKPTATGTDVQTACGSYKWIDGNEYTSSNNTATFTLQSANGCDSVVTLNLTIKPTATGTDVQTACGSYKWIDGNEYTSSNNTATFTLQSANGCDSVVTLNLTIKPTATGTDVQTACGSYKWIDGKEYTNSNNTATFTLQSANGCDSVVTLNLTIKPTATGTDVQTACGSYKWIDGNEYTSSNSTETFTLQSANGCDSVVTLNLTITPDVTPTFAQVGPYCEGVTIPATALPTTSTNGITGSWSPAINNTQTTTYTFTPSLIPDGDCDGAIYLCDANKKYFVSTLNGPGQNAEEPETGTCMDISTQDEQFSAWFTFDAATDGNLTFDIIPNDPTDDIDFILYELTINNPCGPRTVIRCNATSCVPTGGATGLNMTDTDLTENSNCNIGENAYCQLVSAVTGKKYSLLINNSTSNQGFNLQFNQGIPNPVEFASTSGSSSCNNQCVKTATMTITINKPPIVTAPLNDTVCGEYTLPPLSVGNYYTESGGKGTKLSPGSSINTPGKQTIYVYEGTENCFDEESFEITIYPNPLLVVTPGNICSGNTGTITAIPSSKGGTFTWTEFPSNILIPDSDSIIEVKPTSNFIYKVQYTDTNNCKAEQIIPVTVRPRPTLTVSGPTSICPGASALLKTSTALSGGIYIWSPNNETTQDITVSPAETTTYSVYYTINGCQSNTANHTVSVLQAPAVSVNSIGICKGLSATLTATTSSTGGTFSWNTTPVNTNQSITVEPSVTTNYSVTYTSKENCKSIPAIGTVRVTETPTIDLKDVQVCKGESATLTATPSVPGGTFLWSPSATVGETYSFLPTESSTVSVVYTIDGCSTPSKSALVNVLVIPPPDLKDITICDNTDGTLTAVPMQPGGTYLWSTGETTSSIKVLPNPPYEYSVVYSIDGCKSLPAFAKVTVDTRPTISFDANILKGCSPLNVEFVNTTVNSKNCLWDFGDGNQSSDCNMISNVYQKPGCYDVSLKSESINGCSNTLTLSKMICVHPNPKSEFKLSTYVIGEGNNTVYFENISEGAVDYFWNYGDETFDNSIFTPDSHTYKILMNREFIVSLKAISEFGCIDSSFQVIKVSENIVLYIPNTFIPDGDGVNDVWVPIIGAGLIQDSYLLEIYNRWGELVFSTNNYLQGWDGTYKGKKASCGIYSYKIKLRDTKTMVNKNFVGHVNLLK
jgi:gliding motility-associated-like protein